MKHSFPQSFQSVCCPRCQDTDDVRFKKYVLLPIIEKNFIYMEIALENNKYKIYLLYLSLNAYIYYSKSGRLCTLEVVNLIKMILNQLA